MSPKNKYIRLTALATAVYFVSYISRINLAAVMVSLIGSGFAEKTTVALALTVCSVTYGLGQILSGWLGDHCKPQNVITMGFLLTGIMNLGVSLLQSPALLTILWAINGLAQACMWPPLLAVLTSHFTQDEYSRSCVWVSWGSSFGTIAVYLLSPALIRLGTFRLVFAVCGIAAFAMALIWSILYHRHFAAEAHFPIAHKSVSEHSSHPLPCRVLGLVGLIMLSIILHGALRDGVSNWMPTLVAESFGLDSSSAIYTGVLLPIFAIVSIKAASWLYRKKLPNELTASGAIFAVGFAAAACLHLVMGQNMVISALLLAVLVGCMHGVNFILVSMTPPWFSSYGHLSLISGLLNCSTYVGSAISTYGIALVSDSLGWSGTTILWAALAAAGTLLCFVLRTPWRRFCHK